MIANRYVKAQFGNVIEAVKDGSGLSAALSHVDGLRVRTIDTALNAAAQLLAAMPDFAEKTFIFRFWTGEI